jgi:hypothetical protein
MKNFFLLSFAILVSFLPVSPVLAQQKDFQFWPAAGVSVDLPGKFRVVAEEEIRLKENCTQIDRQINSLGVGYRINKYIKASVYYRIEAKWENPDFHIWRQGLYGDLAFRYQKGQFEFDYRSRVQSSKVEFNEKQDRFFGHFTHRHKFGCTYNVAGMPVNLSAESELFYKTGGGYNFSEYRLWGGLAWKPGKTHEFGLKYGIVREVQVEDPLTAFVISLDYTFNIKL